MRNRDTAGAVECNARDPVSRFLYSMNSAVQWRLGLSLNPERAANA